MSYLRSSKLWLNKHRSIFQGRTDEFREMASGLAHAYLTDLTLKQYIATLCVLVCNNDLSDVKHISI